MDITRENLANFKEDFKKLNHAIELKYGISLKLGNISFTSNSFSTKLDAFNNESGVDNTEQLEFNSLCGRYNLKESDYMRSFRLDGGNTIYKLVGFKPKNRKYPIIAINSDGTRYKLPRQLNFI